MAFPLALFALSFALRLFGPLSRPLQWYARAYWFWDRIRARDWANTLYSPHPGVTTMWLVGLGQRIQGLFRPLQPIPLNISAPDFGGVSVTEVVISLIPLVAAISLCIVLIYVLATRLFGRTIAMVGAALLAMDPFHVTYSKVLHVDALLSVLILNALLLALVYVFERRAGFLAASGIFAGLALLTKTPGLILLPMTGLILLVGELSRTQKMNTRYSSSVFRKLAKVAGDYAVWTVLLAGTFILLLPAAWVNLTDVIRTLAEDGLIRHATEEHVLPIYFLGDNTSHDPGMVYYLGALLVHTTAVTLPFALIGALFLLRPEKVGLDRAHAWALAALLLTALLFFLNIGGAAKKSVRYTLPMYPILDLMAGVGIAGWAGWVGRWLTGERSRFAQNAMILLMVLINAFLVLRHLPYLGTSYNDLFGGLTTADYVLAVGDQGEGLDQAMAYLNELAEHQEVIATCSLPQECDQFSEFDLRYDFDPSVQYVVYGRNRVVRGIERLPTDGRRPLAVFQIGGLPFAWIYPAQPPAEAAAPLPPAPPVRPVSPMSIAWLSFIALGAWISFSSAGASRGGEVFRN